MLYKFPRQLAFPPVSNAKHQFADRFVRNLEGAFLHGPLAFYCLSAIKPFYMYRSVFIQMQEIQTQEQWVLYRLERFYSNPEYISKIKSILDGSSDLSLRLIDWFVTNYSKKYNVSYMTKTQKHVIVYLSYKSHLKAYSKRMFDPFCRWKRIKFLDIDTTVGQLNFFEWAINDGVLDYLELNHEKVHADMEKRLHEAKEGREGERRKRHELSHSATKSISRHDVRLTVKFD
jgi:hypothetical protein